MPFSVDKFPSLPAIIFVQSGSQVASEAQSALGQLIPLIDEQTEPVFLIMDVRQLSIGLEELPATAALAALRPDALLHHPKLRETLIVSKEGLVRLAAQGLKSAIFGSVKVKVFETTEGAVDYCREVLAGAAPADQSESMAG